MPSAGGPDVLPRIDLAAEGAGGGSVEVFDILHIVDEKASGTNGGTFTAGSWVTRTLNTERTDEIGSTLASNQFTLPAGTYNIDASAPGAGVYSHQTRLRNITDGTTTLVGTSEWNNDALNAQTRSHIRGRFTIAAEKTFEIQHRSAASEATTGLGVAVAFGEVEVYTQVWIEKVA